MKEINSKKFNMYLIINNKKIYIYKCNTFKSKLLGLSFKKERINYGILLPKCNAIHTFFMKQPIDVCITDKDNKIIFLKENFNRNKILYIKKGYSIYELPLDTVNYLKTNEKLYLYEEGL